MRRQDLCHLPPCSGLSVRILRSSLWMLFRLRWPASPISRNNILFLSNAQSDLFQFTFFLWRKCVLYFPHSLCANIKTKPCFTMGSSMLNSNSLRLYSVFSVHGLCCCWCHTLKPCKSLWCWCWEWNYGKNVPWCAGADCARLFVLVVVWGCLIVALWFWKNTELLDWWNIPEIQHLRALNSLHMSPVCTV